MRFTSTASEATGHHWVDAGALYSLAAPIPMRQIQPITEGKSSIPTEVMRNRNQRQLLCPT